MAGPKSDALRLLVEAPDLLRKKVGTSAGPSSMGIHAKKRVGSHRSSTASVSKRAFIFPSIGIAA